MPSQRRPSQSAWEVIVERQADGGVQYVVRDPRFGLVVNILRERVGMQGPEGVVRFSVS